MTSITQVIIMEDLVTCEYLKNSYLNFFVCLFCFFNNVKHVILIAVCSCTTFKLKIEGLGGKNVSCMKVRIWP